MVMSFMKALILDRDGVINHDYGYVHAINKFNFIKGIFEVCNYFNNNGYLIIIITNQSGIGRNFYSYEAFQTLNDWMIRQFKKKGVIIDKTYYCPHTPEDNCNCRKPKPGMIIEAINDFVLDPRQCVLIGDKASDIEAGKAAGIGILYLFDELTHYNTLDRIKKHLE
jgi:D-glycero-D-manno-heptose 1,7-bisphosphate phosphatase